MLILAPKLFVFPIAHGSASSTLALRKHLMEKSYGQICIPLPHSIQQQAEILVDELPIIHALILEQEGVCAYLPADPCDAYIEAIRQTRQSTTSLHFVGPEKLPNPRSTMGLPDAWALESLDIASWITAHWPYLATRPEPVDAADFFHTVAHHALTISKLSEKETLLVCHITELPALFDAVKNPQSIAPTGLEPLSVSLWPIKPMQLYFALGEMPFFAGFFEQNRQDPFALLPDAPSLAKHLLLRTRTLMQATGNNIKLPPARLQATIQYAIRLAREEGQHMPSLFDWATSAKATISDAFAAKLLEYARSYPYEPEPGPTLRLGLDQIRSPLDAESKSAWNILRDAPLTFKTIKLRRDPKPNETKAWKHSWDPQKSCSHLPEDLRIEHFNARARKQTLQMSMANSTKSSPFSASLLDGIDIRNTIRNWHTGQIWVKEVPPSKSKLDTIIILFDEDHDEKYPHRCTWYAEHNQESTLSFYSTDPFSDMIGPGIAKSRYGGLAMLFPPRHTPDLFEVEGPAGLSASEQLTYASMLYSRERLVGYISSRRPSNKVRELARRLGKHLVWTPLQHYRLETLEALRTFHILNGTHIRSIASRFIAY